MSEKRRNMTQNKKGFWIGLKEYSVITLGLSMYVLGWLLFLIPNNLIGGGVTGLASIVQYATGGTIKIGYTYFVINVILLIAAFFTLGRGFGGKTIYAIFFLSLPLPPRSTLFPYTTLIRSSFI